MTVTELKANNWTQDEFDREYRALCEAQGRKPGPSPESLSKTISLMYDGHTVSYAKKDNKSLTGTSESKLT